MAAPLWRWWRSSLRSRKRMSSSTSKPRRGKGCADVVITIKDKGGDFDNARPRHRGEGTSSQRDRINRYGAKREGLPWPACPAGGVKRHSRREHLHQQRYWIKPKRSRRSSRTESNTVRAQIDNTDLGWQLLRHRTSLSCGSRSGRRWTPAPPLSIECPEASTDVAALALALRPIVRKPRLRPHNPVKRAVLRTPVKRRALRQPIDSLSLEASVPTAVMPHSHHSIVIETVGEGRPKPPETGHVASNRSAQASRNGSCVETAWSPYQQSRSRSARFAFLVTRRPRHEGTTGTAKRWVPAGDTLVRRDGEVRADLDVVDVG